MECPRATRTSEDCDQSSHSLVGPFAYPDNPHQDIINHEVPRKDMISRDSNQHAMCPEHPLREPMRRSDSDSDLQNQKIPVASPDVRRLQLPSTQVPHLQVPSTQVPHLQVPRLQHPSSQAARSHFPGPDILRLPAPCFQGRQAQGVPRFGAPGMQVPGFRFPQANAPPLELASHMDVATVNFVHSQVSPPDLPRFDNPSFQAPPQVGTPPERPACKLEPSEPQEMSPDISTSQRNVPQGEVARQQVALPPRHDVTRAEPPAGPSLGLPSDADAVSDGWLYGEPSVNPGVLDLSGAGPGPQGFHPPAAVKFPYPVPSHFPSPLSLHPSFLPASGPSDPSLARAYLQQIGGSAHKRKRSEKKPIPDEQKDEKYYEKRARNNGAAKRSRDLRKQREENMAIRASMLERQNDLLKNEIFFYYEKAKNLQQVLLAKMANPQR